MTLIHGDGLTCFQFPALAKLPGFFHGVFLRKAIDASGRMAPFNLGLGHGTPDETVWQNRKQLLGFFGPDNFGVYARQVHGTDIAVIPHRDERDASHNSPPLHFNGDALISDVQGAALVIQVADCQPVIIVDPITGAVANVHSGWRGSLQNILGEAIRQMEAHYDSRPADLVCGIGPSLGPCCAEFVNYKDEIPQPFWKYRQAGDLFDFWRISRDQLTGAGVRSENISLAEMCTKCNQHLFFSYRGDQRTGRLAAVVGIQLDKGSKR